jgi:hypothetical protein
VFVPLYIFPANNQKRDRGESFYNCLNSNTTGHGNIWVSLSAVGHVWDNTPISMDSNAAKSKWISNIRAFPEIKTQFGLFDVASFSLESRVLGKFWSPGWVSFDCKLTPPNNKELRFHGYGLNMKYKYQFIESGPSLGGYTGFMPEGYVTKGHNIETRFMYELDLLARISKLPLRLLVNNGIRIPLREDRRNFYQFLTDVAIVYSGYGFDFFASYSLEAFNNFIKPAVLQTNENKRIAVFFQENPMYLIFGGNLRYDNGLTLSISVPILLSMNRESKMTPEDLSHLNQLRSDQFPEEVKYRIKDPFDPWFVKWKIAGSLTFPIRFSMTSSELMRNYLILKNRKQDTKIDIDNKLISNNPESSTDSTKIEDRTRLEQILKRKTEIK